MKMLLDSRQSAEMAEEYSAEGTEPLLSELTEGDLVAALALNIPKHWWRTETRRKRGA